MLVDKFIESRMDGLTNYIFLNVLCVRGPDGQWRHGVYLESIYLSTTPPNMSNRGNCENFWHVHDWFRDKVRFDARRILRTRNRQRLQTLLMGTHPRGGAGSPVQHMPADVFEMIAKHVVPDLVFARDDQHWRTGMESHAVRNLYSYDTALRNEAFLAFAKHVLQVKGD